MTSNASDTDSDCQAELSCDSSPFEYEDSSDDESANILATQQILPYQFEPETSSEEEEIAGTGLTLTDYHEDENVRGRILTNEWQVLIRFCSSAFRAKYFATLYVTVFETS